MQSFSAKRHVFWHARPASLVMSHGSCWQPQLTSGSLVGSCRFTYLGRGRPAQFTARLISGELTAAKVLQSLQDNQMGTAACIIPC